MLIDDKTGSMSSRHVVVDDEYPESIFSEEMEELLSRNAGRSDEGEGLREKDAGQPVKDKPGRSRSKEEKPVSKTRKTVALNSEAGVDNHDVPAFIRTRVVLHFRTYFMLKMFCSMTKESQSNVVEKAVRDYIAARHDSLKDSLNNINITNPYEK